MCVDDKNTKKDIENKLRERWELKKKKKTL